MASCKSCGRKLDADEIEYCPACKSEDVHKKKKKGGILSVLVVVFVGVVIFIASGGKRVS